MFLRIRRPARADRTHTLPRSVADLPRATLGEAPEADNFGRRWGVFAGCVTPSPAGLNGGDFRADHKGIRGTRQTSTDR